MYNHTYLKEMIADSKEADFRASNMNSVAIITDAYSGENIKVPYASITNKYADVLSPYVKNVIFTQSEFDKYKYKPKLFCEDLYKTTELWSSILQLNGMLSVLDFNRFFVKIYDPRTIDEILNELLILEGKAE